jgi:hypothetical protein
MEEVRVVQEKIFTTLRLRSGQAQGTGEHGVRQGHLLFEDAVV